MTEVVSTKTISEHKVGTATGTASRYKEGYMRNGTVVDGTVEFNELEGKIIHYVDRDCKLKTERVYKVDGNFLRTKDATGKKHRVAKTQIIFAYMRKNGNPKEVI